MDKKELEDKYANICLNIGDAVCKIDVQTQRIQKLKEEVAQLDAVYAELSKNEKDSSGQPA